jgi:hypothetical protein
MTAAVLISDLGRYTRDRDLTSSDTHEIQPATAARRFEICEHFNLVSDLNQPLPYVQSSCQRRCDGARTQLLDSRRAGTQTVVDDPPARQDAQCRDRPNPYHTNRYAARLVSHDEGITSARRATHLSHAARGTLNANLKQGARPSTEGRPNWLSGQLNPAPHLAPLSAGISNRNRHTALEDDSQPQIREPPSTLKQHQPQKHRPKRNQRLIHAARL